MSSEPSPGSTTPDIMRAYSYPPSPSSPDTTYPNRPSDGNPSLQPPGSRFSGTSWSPTSMLFTADKSLLGSSETNGIAVSMEFTGKGPGSTTNVWRGWRVVLFGSWFNLLLLLIPVSWTLSFVLEKHHKVIFIFSILSMIPLVKLHDLSSRELALRIGGTKAGLLNASMSNTVEMVIAITCAQEVRIKDRTVFANRFNFEQTTYVVHVTALSNDHPHSYFSVLVLGMCFFAGGLRFSEQGFDQTATQIHSSLLSISVGALLLPAAYHFAISGDKDSGSHEQKNDILKMSYGVSIVLMFIYIAYLLFQFWSHKHLYKDTKKKSDRLSVKIPVNPRYLSEKLSMSMSLNDRTGSMHDRQISSSSSRRISVVSSIFPPLHRFPYRNSPLNSSSEVTLTGSKENLPETTNQGATEESADRLVEEESPQDTQPEHGHVDGSTIGPLNPPWSPSPIPSTADTSPFRGTSPEPEPMTTSEQANLRRSPSAAESFREPQLSWMVTLLLLTVVTITVSITAEDLVESMDGISTTVSKQWVGLVLLPAVSSIAECVTAVNTSVKDQLNLSVSIAVGSSIQTTLLVIPFMVTLGWIIDRPLALLFDPFESVVLYVSVQTMSYVVADGKSNWLEGIILICLYVIIAVSFWFYPSEVNSHLTL
ncbi:Sodium/calcium exchanger protein-domain-containing protein [Suillus paluster]|uniref:Sodium/calcium exchanger protein-domain-containing protein n=1 Tax=Suillus paluster TaxID=48578 RepID=UPI001B878446|nr:Sodium/calcium exchanger protein-domain-containing protein [Suillus paluster]KAG1729671.1 Sodium/calcium exchanger protein-domain-containing protein [Suillus paluster]